jgi:hypothetical protein
LLAGCGGRRRRRSQCTEKEEQRFVKGETWRRGGDGAGAPMRRYFMATEEGEVEELAGRWRLGQRRKERRRRSWPEGGGAGKTKTKPGIGCLLAWFMAERAGDGQVAPPVFAELVREGEYFVVR